MVPKAPAQSNAKVPRTPRAPAPSRRLHSILTKPGDGAGIAYVAGATLSTDFPVTKGALRATNNGFFDGFVTRLSATGGAVPYSTLFGGKDSEWFWAIGLDGVNACYVAGAGYGGSPTTVNAIQAVHAGNTDGIVLELTTW